MRPIWKYIGFFLFFLSAVASLHAATFNGQVETIMTAVLEKMPVKPDAEATVYIQPPVAVGQNLYAGTGFARHLRAALEANLRPPFVLIPRDQLDTIWAEVKLGQVTATADPEKMLQDLKLIVTEQATLPLDAILIAEYGQWLGNPQQVRVNLYLIDVKNVRKYTVTETLHLTGAQAEDSNFPPTDAPQNHQRVESSHPAVETELIQLVEANSDLHLDPQAVLFELFVSVDKGHGGVYEEGEAITVSVSAEIDCYIAVINVDSSDRWGVLFPNEISTDNFLRAGDLKGIPPAGETGYDLGIEGPNLGIFA